MVPLQNGVEAEDMLCEVLGLRFVMGGVAYIFADIAEPGVIQHVGEIARLAFGELDAGMKTSMLTDLEADKPLELEWLNGAIVRLGAEAGLGTPANAEVVEALKPFAGGAGRNLSRKQPS